MSFPLVEIASVVKNYGGTQPLRVDVLRLDRGERFTLAGLTPARPRRSFI
jgi:hypothetical protein